MKRRSEDNVKKAGGYAFSVICGIAVSGVFTVLFSFVMYALGFPPASADAMSLMALAAGCFAGGFVCGSIKRRKGLRNGVICAALMIAPLFSASVISGSFTGDALAGKLILGVLSSCTGSVIGVDAAVRKMR